MVGSRYRYRSSRSMMFIPDPNFPIPDSDSQVKKAMDPGSTTNNLGIFNAKKLLPNCEKKIMIQDVYLGSRIRIFSIPDTGFGSIGKKAMDAGSDPALFESVAGVEYLII
jgi:hypothetical protein